MFSPIPPLIDGLALPDAALLLNRVVVGAFFAISGYHKLFNRDRHAALVETLTVDRIPLVRVNQWFVPSVELVGGASLMLGMVSVWAALLLGAVCLVATCADGLKRVREYHPIDACDWVDDLLYLPEVLYGIMLVEVILNGPGAYSLDYVIWR
jgi:uncharacterized membrane protein YphA (DoxX/SURF4 family)